MGRCAFFYSWLSAIVYYGAFYSRVVDGRITNAVATRPRRNGLVTRANRSLPMLSHRLSFATLGTEIREGTRVCILLCLPVCLIPVPATTRSCKASSCVWREPVRDGRRKMTASRQFTPTRQAVPLLHGSISKAEQLNTASRSASCHENRKRN